MESDGVAGNFGEVFRQFWRRSHALRKWVPVSAWGARPKKLSLCETLSLGEKRFVAVVRFEKRQFLVGGTGQSIALLAELPSDSTQHDPGAGDFSRTR
jgi:flagellar biogenesis protein FliO